MTNSASCTMDRRRFLLYSSTCVVAPAALASASTPEGRPEAGEALAVGYWRDEEDPARLPSPDTAFRVIPAQSLPSGDSRLAHAGARVTIHGLYGAAPTLESRGVRSAALRVRFPTVEFNPWSFSAARFSRLSRPLDFVVPVDGEQGLDLALELDLASDRWQRILLGRGCRELAVHLGLGREPGQAKLREGFYFLPLRPGAPAAFDVRTEPCLLLSVEVV